jgi:acetyltransferase-like isoleucine patch superfamily enzyme
MTTGLGIYRRYRVLFSYYNLFRFTLRKIFIGFDVANQFIQRVDKQSLQLILKKNGATIGYNCDIETGLVFHNCDNFSNLVIGNNCHIGKHCLFDLRDKIEIEDNVVISMQTALITHQDLSNSELSVQYPASAARIYIGANSYIGSGTILLKGTDVGRFSIIAAKSLVTKNVPSFTLVGGVPAKFIKTLKINP